MIIITVITSILGFMSVLSSAIYIELDHNLVPRTIEDINSHIELSGRVKPHSTRVATLVMKKYNLQNETMKTVLQKVHKAKSDSNITYEAVIGSAETVWFDHDWGFFSAVLAAYNNHWVLKTSPDDWWNVIVRNVAQVIDEKGNRLSIRHFFVDHKGKKEITVLVPSLGGINYSWLFDQFSEGIKQNINTPGYVDLMQADFSTTTPQQLITTQIMLMSSVQKYFHYTASTLCGVPGVDMSGTLEDWYKLAQKLLQLETLLKPISRDLGLARWFRQAKVTIDNLLDTYRGQPDKEWWGHILSWNVEYARSGGSQWFSGWMTEFLMAESHPEAPPDFPRGVVSVPLKLRDLGVEDTGILVAGTVGFTVEEAGRAPAVEAKQGWTLLMPTGSPITPRLRGN